MYLDHDYTYDEYGSRSIFTELHDGEVPVPYEQTGNMCVISTTYPMPTSSSPSSSPTSASSSSFMGPGNSIFQTVMRGYHGNSLFSSSSGTGDNNNTNANASNKNNIDNGNNSIIEGGSTGTKDCHLVSHHSAQENVQQDRGEEFIDLFRLRLGEKDAHSYLNSKNADKPVSILDPYNVDCMVDLFQRAKV